MEARQWNKHIINFSFLELRHPPARAEAVVKGEDSSCVIVCEGEIDR